MRSDTAILHPVFVMTAAFSASARSRPIQFNQSCTIKNCTYAIRNLKTQPKISPLVAKTLIECLYTICIAGKPAFFFLVMLFVSYLAVTKATTPIRSNKAVAYGPPLEVLFLLLADWLEPVCLSLAAAVDAAVEKNAPPGAQKVETEAGGEMRQKDHLQKE